MTVTDINTIDAIGIKEDKLSMVIIDYLDWEFEDMHLEVLESKINSYINYVESKQYVSQYGDNFKKIIFEIQFQYKITKNGLKFIDFVSQKLKKEGIILQIHLP
ncbi:DUF6572 domain-containing protein [Listeria sp. ILCC792]|uniref:DUF6572 domain-containing protein n=1 Tax=Listeria sp. ILCC792 TaxID=1918331 RepID=UPI000B5878E5|nr:DUF6572 domain-containing protein [Listeria sp. ILCC792]